MAGGYLGKISAVISANTGDYVRGLNEGAKATRDFAKTVQSTLNRSATEAAKAFEGIYTPLQQFERAIRQAGALRLNFKGFEGAVRNINDLQKRLSGVLTTKEVELIVKTSGLKDIQAVKDAINSLDKKEISLAAVAGGRAGLLRERERLRASGADSTSIAGVKATTAQIDALIAKLDVLDDRKIDLIIDIVNQRGLDAAIEKARAFQDIAINVTKPLTAAVQTFGQLSGQVQASFVPALKVAQQEAEKLQLSFSPERFESARRSVAAITASINQLAEAQRLASAVPTGRELAFSDPRLNANLRAAGQAGQAALGLPASFIQQNPQVSELAQQVSAVSQRAVEAAANLKEAFGTSRAAAARQEYERINGVLETLIERLNRAAGVRGPGEDLARRIGNGFLNVITPQEAARDTPNAFRARSASSLLNVITPAEAAADTVEAQAQALGRRIGNGFLTIITPAEAAADTVEAQAQALGRRIGNSLLNVITPAEAARDTPNAFRARAASGRLNVLQQESDNISNQGLSTPLTGSRAPRARVLDGLRGEIDTTRRLIGDLAGPLREQLGPEVDRINNEFRQLARDGIGVSADAARRLNGEVNAITSSLQRRRSIGREFSEQFGGRGAAGLGLGVDQQSLRAVGGQIEFVQQRLGRLTADVRGPTLQALERFRATAQRLFDAGTIDTESGRRELAALRQELAQTLSTAGGGSVRSLTQGLARVGDVARGGFDRFSLGIQQAAFAVEDFFSVTGGLDQRVRAAGNNISQLGFILGGTSGLIAGIAGAIGSQLIVALIKWANAGRTTEDQMKAINDVLSRQKSLVEELADAFRSLGDSIGRGALSPAARDAQEFGKSLDDIRKKQKELRDQRAFSLDEGVLRARADVSVAENRLARASTRDAAVAAQRQLREARERLRQEEERIRNRPDFSLDAARARTDDIFSRARDTNADRAAAAAAAAGGGAGAAQGARRTAFDEGERIRRRVEAQLAGQNDPAIIREVLRREQAVAAASGDNRLVAQLEELINSLGDPAARAIDALATRILEGGADKVGQSLERSRGAVDAALSAGVAGAQGFSSQIDEVTRILGAALTQLEKAISIEDEDQRRAAVAAAEQAVQAAQRQADALDEQRKGIEASTASINRFIDALQRVTQAAESNLNAAEGRRDRAREEALGRPTPRNQRALERAERDVQRQEELRNNARLEARLAEERARQDPQTQAEERRIRQIDQLLQTTGVLAPWQRETLIQEQESLRARAERLARQAVDNDPRVREARDASIREEQRQQMVAEGRNLLLDDGQRARIELDNQIASVQAATGDRIAEAIREGRFNDIAAIQADQRGAEGRLREDAARQVAPTIFGLADQVANAVLQGPSRAALAPTDVTTMEGSRELTRLLRGDDAARNQDLVNLQKEANKLLSVIANNPVPVAQ